MTQDRKLWRNARLATCDESMGVVENGAVLTAGGRIEWVGPESELPDAVAGGKVGARAGAGTAAPYEEHDLGGAWVTPGLIDCHTHLVFAGTRAGEYAQRLRGRSYAEIAREGGGILSTMRAVRAASLQQLIDESAPRLQALLAEGVTTIEIKSGYGLTLADEAKMLRAARALAQAYPVTVKTTFLAAHTVPPEFTGRADEYIDTIISDWLPTLHDEGLIDAVDVFCESIAFSVAQSERLFDAAHDRGLPVKMHAEQLTNLGGTQMASRHHALSCDHLEYATEVEAAALASSRTVAVLLPVAFYCLADERKPPIQAFRSAGAHMALATDCNPGSAPATSLLLTMSMGTRLFGLTSEEALAGVTRNAARALGLQADRGTLARGQAADFVIWNVQAIEELSYWIGFNPRRTVVRAGRIA
ncbi:MAG TPA: imidazolonepropionase [Steroidobacteraceae bacterium]|jgi:imidazolonepropionase|nr:imidazolonepropionase [Steroidobacteraceae bacterium]